MAALYLVILLASGWLMMSRRLTATLALPATALVLAICAVAAEIPAQGVSAAATMLVTDVIEAGVARLAGAIFAVILGAVLAAQMGVSGAAERLIRYATEYAGENRVVLAINLLLAIAVLFTALGGLGAVILVASVALPLMLSLGFEPRVAGVVFLFGLSLGGCLNPVNWQLYKDVLQLPPERIVPFALALAFVFFIVCAAYIVVKLARRIGATIAIWFAGPVAACGAIAWLLHVAPAYWTLLKLVLCWLLLALVVLLAILALLRFVLAGTCNPATAPAWVREPGNWLASASVLVPLCLLLWSSLRASLAPAGAAVFSVPILTALLAGILFCALASFTRDGAAANRLMRALHQAVTQSAPAIILLIGIGLLLQATALPSVKASFSPLLASLPLGNPLGFVALFFIFSPLALYRGPLNLWGMGSGIVGVLAESGALAPGLIMVAFFSVGMLQGVCDPTNTHNVWIANFCRVPVNELTRESFGWTAAVVLAGLVIGALQFMA